MNTKAAVLNAKPFICIAAVAACAALLGPVQANDHEVTVNIPVSSAGLDLSQPAGAREIYRRLQRAAVTACGDGRRVDLEPVASLHGCYEKALGNAVRSVNLPLLTQVYLETHSPREAAAFGDRAACNKRGGDPKACGTQWNAGQPDYRDSTDRRSADREQLTRLNVH
jgi:UrcA family protein